MVKFLKNVLDSLMLTVTGGDLDDRKVSFGLFQTDGSAASWRSKKQTYVTLSTVETEYMALASAAQ